MSDDRLSLALVAAIVLLMVVAAVFVLVAALVGLDLGSEPLALSVVGFLGATIAGLLAGLLARMAHNGSFHRGNGDPGGSK